ncbi:hypothetical protein [uncultured Chryseobacterium sp.]|uniref:hypothetical protein n=1 Tax=uncultured Chryseobacterium sp. TaxID=259322 RepID=UPI0025EFF34E|nr:hypothetical protein [uncultured Chryseobacterium sp.]
MKKYLLIILINIFCSSIAFAQVGINTDQPNSSTGLHVSERKNPSSASPDKYNGIIIQRYTTAERDTNLTPNMASAQNSLMIYNTTEDCYNYWNNVEQEWKSLCGKLGKSQFTFDCAAVQIKGTYVQGRDLSTTNYLSIPVTVTKAGEYTLMATTTNGYSFFVSGTFLNTGSYTILALGQGKPVAIQTDDLAFNANGIDVACTPAKTVTVLSAAGTYTMSCSTATVNGIYKVGTSLTASNTITLPVTVTTLGSYSITTNTVDGISFSGSGTFTVTGTQNITLSGTGAPASTPTKTLTITSDSQGGVSTNCSVSIRITIPVKRILGIGLPSQYGYQVADAIDSHARKMLDSQKNFGISATSTVASNGYTYVSLGNSMSASTLNAQINSASPPDIIQIGYSADIDASSATVLANYAKNGGVVLLFSEENAGVQRFINELMGSSVTVSTLGDSGNRYVLTNSTHSVVNGPFGNLGGQAWGDDGAGTRYVQNIDATQIEVLSTVPGNTNAITAFVHKKYHVVFIGDGGFFAGQINTYGDASWPVTQPFTINNTNDAQPVVNTAYGATGSSNGIGTIYNSYLFGNIFAWAIYQAEISGFNKH